MRNRNGANATRVRRPDVATGVVVVCGVRVLVTASLLPGATLPEAIVALQLEADGEYARRHPGPDAWNHPAGRVVEWCVRWGAAPRRRPRRTGQEQAAWARRHRTTAR
jgi:hypothetical protein